MIQQPLTELVSICTFLEPLIRPLGWHCAATGSALYGQSGHHPEDLDILLYRHNGFDFKRLRPFDVLLKAGFRNIQDCTGYPEFDGEPHRRKVFRVILPSGTKIDFLCIDEAP